MLLPPTRACRTSGVLVLPTKHPLSGKNRHHTASWHGWVAVMAMGGHRAKGPHGWDRGQVWWHWGG